MYGCLHADICNVPQLLINGVKMQIKITKANPAFYLLCNTENSKVYFKVLEAFLYVKRIRPSAGVIIAHTRRLSCQIQRNKNRTQDFYIFCRFTITLHGQCCPGSTPETVDCHHGQEHRLSWQYVFESIQLPSLRSNTLCYVC